MQHYEIWCILGTAVSTRSTFTAFSDSTPLISHMLHDRLHKKIADLETIRIYEKPPIMGEKRSQLLYHLLNFDSASCIIKRGFLTVMMHT